ncbi:hypothetical protein ACET3Z_001791 [Daucus carota]
MSWFRRLKEDVDLYHPRQCPDYSEPGDFTLKIYHGGKWVDNPRAYVGGTADFFDFCNADQIIIIEIYNMLKEVDEFGFHQLWYKLPSTSFDRGSFALDNDEELMTMCELISDVDKYMEIYVTTMAHLSTEPCRDSDVEFVEPTPKEAPAKNNPAPLVNMPAEENVDDQEEFEFDFDNTQFWDTTQNEIEIEPHVREMEGLEEEFSDTDSDDEDFVPKEKESSDETFHCDSSNQDDSDDDLLFQRNVDQEVHDNSEKSSLSNSTIYGDSDDERIACNTTDDEDCTTKHSSSLFFKRLNSPLITLLLRASNSGSAPLKKLHLPFT